MLKFVDQATMVKALVLSGWTKSHAAETKPVYSRASLVLGETHAEIYITLMLEWIAKHVGVNYI